jgi:Ca2+-binding EF-hand superfamily protein
MRTLSIIGLTLLAGTLASAQSQHQNFPAQDRNGDGIISQDEWQGTQHRFRQLDQNGDGVLSGSELPRWFQREMQNSSQRGYSDRNGYSNQQYGSADRSNNTANRLDKNRDGVVEGYEWPYNSRVFHQLDTNRDSVLEPEELQNINQATLNELDRNHNGVIDPDEWAGGFAKFDDLDQNHDGRVSAEEYSQRGSEWERRQRFDNWDSNRDGVISRNEWKSSDQLFRRLDRNGDSVISRDEFMGNTDRYDTPNGWR